MNDRNSERIEKDSQFLVIYGTQRTLERVRGMAVVVRIDVFDRLERGYLNPKVKARD